jgi:hypothetical protein
MSMSVAPGTKDCHTATHWPWVSVASETHSSMREPSLAAPGSSGAGSDHVAPSSVERATRMSPSLPIVPPSVSREPQTAIQVPARSVSICGPSSSPKSVAALVLSGTGAVQLAPSSLERATKMSVSHVHGGTTALFVLQTATQWPVPSVATRGPPSLSVSLAASVLRA